MYFYTSTSIIYKSFYRWYREGSAVPLQAPTSKGGSKDHRTTSTLSMTPRREDDGAKFRCVVWNRAMAEGDRLETTVTLGVNCKYPSFPLAHLFTYFFEIILYSPLTTVYLYFSWAPHICAQIVPLYAAVVTLI